MEKQTTGTVTAVRKQWWLKVNQKSLRVGPLDGAAFPHVITVRYTVDGKDYKKHKWIGINERIPGAGEKVAVFYHPDKPSKAKIRLNG